MSDSDRDRASLGAFPDPEIPVSDPRTPPSSDPDEVRRGPGVKVGDRQPICYNCKKSGHLQAKCPERPVGSPITCAKCGKRGHKAATCRAGGRDATKELTVALKDAIDKESAKDAAIKELRAELADKKADEKPSNCAT